MLPVAENRYVSIEAVTGCQGGQESKMMNSQTEPRKPQKVRKAVLPVAGLGTRFLPATKAIPKEMLTVVDKPLIQYAIEECIASGIEHIIFVTGRRKSSIEDHFDLAPELESFLEGKGKSDLAKMVRDLSGGMHFTYTRQSEALGLGHAVLCASTLVGDEPFAVLLGDVIMEGAVPATRELMEIYEATGSGAIHVERVPRERVHLYGIIDGVPAPDEGRRTGIGDRLLHIKNLVEKPSAEKAPSNLGVTGRYVLPPEIFAYLRETKPGAGGEIQLTDALCRLVPDNRLFGCIYEGRTHDAGDKFGFLQATVELALKDPKLGPDFRKYLKTLKL
jgi:UTP--glucose-1-phosphate uridylyltransferase